MEHRVKHVFLHHHCTMYRHHPFSQINVAVFIVQRKKHVCPISINGKYTILPLHNSMTLSSHKSQTVAHFTRCPVLYCMTLPLHRSQTAAQFTQCGVQQGADGICAPFLIRKNGYFYFAGDHCQWLAASLVLLQTCDVKNKSNIHDF